MIKTNFMNSKEWTNNVGYNEAFLRLNERFLNDSIRARGYIYLNQIYEALGLPWDPDKENILFRSDENARYVKYPGRFVLEYFSGSEILLIHDVKEEES